MTHPIIIESFLVGKTDNILCGHVRFGFAEREIIYTDDVPNVPEIFNILEEREFYSRMSAARNAQTTFFTSIRP